MTYSEIKIKFNESPGWGTILKFDISNGLRSGEIKEEFVLFRASNYQVLTDSGLDGIGSAENYVESFNLDYNSTDIYEVSRVGNEVTIKSKNPLISFSNGSAILYPPLGGLNPFIVDVQFTYNNFQGSIFGINNVEFEEAANPCTHIKVKVSTTELATKITAPVSVNPNNNNPFYFEILRDSAIKIICNNATNQEAIQKVFLPKSLIVGNFETQVNNSPNGATVVVKDNTPNTFGIALNLQYSLDNATWQESNVFSGLVVNNYTVYIKDNYGCSINKSFVVDDFGIQEPYFYLSNSNSIRFAKRVDFDNCNNLKNDENTLSHEANVGKPYKEIQQFQSCDIITTQVKSNYTNISAEVIQENANPIPLFIEKKTNNLRLKDKRDARKYNYGNGKTGIFFLNGKIYDFDTGIYTNNDYALNGSLPEWGVIGNYIQINGAWHKIEEISFDEDKNAEILVIDSVYTGLDTIIQASSLYNRFNYEVYEFSLNMADLVDKNFQIKVLNTDDAFETETYLSEEINVKEIQKNTVEIVYKNDTNTDVFYATGIEHKIRIIANKINAKLEDNSETYKTDTSAILLNAELFEVNEFVFEPVTKGIMTKLSQALSHKIVFINGVGYVKNSEIEIEGALEDTNLYIVKASMVKTNKGYSSESNDTTSATSDISVEIPNLLETDGDFVIY
jgi:hypothetical protein